MNDGLSEIAEAEDPLHDRAHSEHLADALSERLDQAGKEMV